MKQESLHNEDFFLSPPMMPQHSPLPQLSPLHHLDTHDPLHALLPFSLYSPPLSPQPHQDYPSDDGYPQPLVLEAQPMREGEDEPSPKIGNRSEVPSTRFYQVREQHQPPFLELNAEGSHVSQIRNIILFLIEHSELREDLLEAEGRHLSEGDPQLRQIFRILAHKFGNLRKTKEELTKYCMRRAFKFLGDPLEHTRDYECGLKEYFLEADGPFAIPFKKHSLDKTMNSAFLQRVFSNERFSLDYRRFLDQFQVLAEEDNLRKVDYLTDQVEHLLKNGDLNPLHKIKRLPWTRTVLTQLKNLAATLPDTPREGRTARPRR